MTEKSAFQIQIENMDKKLDDHGDDLKKIQEALGVIAVQSNQISNLQAMQGEMRGDLNALSVRLSTAERWQATCPRKSVGRLWGFIVGIGSTFGLVFLYHVLSTVKP